MTRLLTFGASLARKSFPHCSSRFGARGLDVSPFYRHIAPLERKVKSINLDGKLMGF